MRAKKRMGTHQEPAEWLESIGVHKEAEGFGWYKAQEALGKNERGQDSSTEDADEKQRAIEAIFEEGEDSRTKRRMDEVLRRREIGHAKAREVMLRERRIVQGATS